MMPSPEQMLEKLDSITDVNVIKPPVKMICIDTETAGIDPKNYGIIELSVIIDIEGKPVDSQTFLMCPSVLNFDDKALEIQGRTLAQVLSYPPEIVVHKAFIAFLSEHFDKYDPDDKGYLLAYNSKFDDDHLRSHFKRCKDDYYGSFFNNRRLDPLDLLAICEYLGIYEPHSSRKLEYIAKMFDIEINAHSAESDINATRTLWYKLLDKLNLQKGVLL